MFKPSTSPFENIVQIVSALVYTRRQCQVLKLTALHFEYATNTVALGSCTLTVYNWPKHTSVIMSSPSGDLTRTLPPPISKRTPLSSSLERDIVRGHLGWCLVSSESLNLLVAYWQIVYHIPIIPYFSCLCHAVRCLLSIFRTTRITDPCTCDCPCDCLV